MMILTNQRFYSVGRTVDRCFRNFRHKGRKSTGVIDFPMIDDDIIDLLKIHLFLEVIQEFSGMRFPDSIDQYGFFFLDEVSILTRAMIYAVVIPVEVVEFPVNFTYP